MSFGHALYYPHIDLTNKNWLKHALLFWDEISRIVPGTFTPSDSEEIIKIRYETNFIKDYSPNKWDISHTFNEFSIFLERFINSDDLFGHFRQDDNNWRKYRQDRKMFRDNEEFRRDMLRATTLSKGSYIHVAKMDRALKEKLFEIRDKMIKLSKNVGITDGEISNILRDYAPKPNEDLTSYRQKKYRR